MSEEILAALLSVLARGGRGALASVIRTGGSTPQTVGARLLLAPDGTRVGTVGGGAIEHAVIPWCEQHGMAVVAYSPFGHNDFPSARSKGGEVLQSIAQAHDATPRQVALAFLTRAPSVLAIPKASSAEHAVDNAAAGDLTLDAAEISALDKAFPRGPRPRSLPML